MPDDARPNLTEPLFDPSQDVITEAASLHGLAHPLRLRLLHLLRREGPSTASRLAEALNMSSGLTSYHVRELAKAGFVVDATAEDLIHVQRGGGRERWWKATRRSTYVNPPPVGDEDAAAATTEYLGALLEAQFANARQWLTEAHRWPEQWQGLSNFSDVTLSLTPVQTRELEVASAGLLARYPRCEPGAPADEGAGSVNIQYQVFPVR